MNLKAKISWINSLLYIFALIFIMYNIISYTYSRPMGLISVFIIFNFSMFYFLRNSYYFKMKTIVYFYVIGIVGSFLMFVLNPIYVTFFMAVCFYLVFMKTIKKIKDIDEEEIKSNFLFDASIFIFFLMLSYYIYGYLFPNL